jgi:hypothetical protein
VSDGWRLFIEEHVPDRLAQKLARGVRPCVTASSARCSDDKIPVGGSKFCGQPDVPDGFEWPTHGGEPCWFIAQFRMADVAGLDTGYQLPRTGLLSFFYHDHQGTAGPGSHVFYFPETPLQRIAVVPDERYGGPEFHERHLFPRALTLAQGYSLPADPDDFGLTEKQLEDWDWEEAFEFGELFRARYTSGRHQMFGHHVRIKPPRGYSLLACFGEVEDRYHYFVPKSAVEKCEFQRVQVVYECS